MRLRRSNEGPATPEIDRDPAAAGVWDGLLPSASGPVVINAPRAADASGAPPAHPHAA